MAARREWPPEDTLRWTPRQRQVLELIARGHTNGQIAESLGISFAGAKWHVSEVISRLGVSSREDAGSYWREAHGMRRKARHVAQAIFSVGAAKLVAAATGVAVLGAAIIAVLVLASGDGSGSDDEARAAQPATGTASPAAGTATPAIETATVPAAPIPVPTTIVPDGLDEDVVDMIQRAGVPLDRVTWVQQTVEAENYALTLHGAYADSVRTVAFATARPVDGDAEGALPWINNIAYALLTDGSGTLIEPRGSGGGYVREEETSGVMLFPPLSSPSDRQRVTIRYNELAGPHQQYVWASWGFTFDLPVYIDTVVMPDLPPGPLSDGRAALFIDSIVVSALQVTIEWHADGVDETYYDTTILPGIEIPRGIQVIQPGGSGSRIGGWFGIDQDPTTISGVSSFIADGPGDYVIVFGDPGTSTARWAFTLP
jgi:DNA-binding CsgD family transcriptional regulator